MPNESPQPGHPIHVLSRDRLLRKPGGFEGHVLLVSQIDLDSRYQTVVVKCPDRPGGDVQVDAAGPPLARDALSRENRSVRDGDGLQRSGDLVEENIRLHPASKALCTCVRRLIPWRDEHDIAVDQRDGGVEVLIAEGFEPAPDGFARSPATSTTPRAPRLRGLRPRCHRDQLGTSFPPACGGRASSAPRRECRCPSLALGAGRAPGPCRLRP